MKKLARRDAKPVQRTDGRSTKVRDAMRYRAKSIARAAALHVPTEDWKLRIDERRDAVRDGQQWRGDNWSNAITAFGVIGRDKRTGGSFLSTRLSDLEAEDLWRGDDLAARAIETVPNQIVRAGFEIHVQSPKGEAEKKRETEREAEVKGRLDWLRSTDGVRWWSRKVDNLVVANEIKLAIKAKIRSDLAADVFPPTKVQKANESGKEISELMMAKVEDLNVLETFGDALKTERGQGGAAIFPGIRDGVKDLRKPLDEGKIQSVDWLDVLTPLELIPYQWYDDPTEPKYGQPELYWMQRIPIGNIGAMQRIPIHESRLIRFDGIVVSKRQLHEHWGWGDSVLVRMLEVLRDFQMSWQGAALLIQDFAQAVVSIEGLHDAIATGEADLIQERAKAIDTGRSIARAILLDAKETFARQSTPVTGLADMLDRFCNRLAAAAHMPVTLLFGQAPAGLNATGDSDVRAFYDNISANRERKLKPKLMQLFKWLFLADDSPTNGVEPEKWTLTFGALWQPTEQEEATRRKTIAETDMIYITAGVLLPEEVAISRYGGDKWSAETTLNREVREAFDEQATAQAEEEAARMQLESESNAEAKVEHAKAAGAAGLPITAPKPGGPKPGEKPAPGDKPAEKKKDGPFAPAARPASLPWTSTGELITGLGVPRSAMPQIVSAVAQEFLAGLGVEITEGVRRVGELRPMQDAIRPDKVRELIEKFPPETLRKPIIISSDDFILDGHHRWAALRQLGADEEIQTRKVDLPANGLLAAARRFHKAEYRDFDEASIERDEHGKFAGGGGREPEPVGLKVPKAPPGSNPRFYSFGPNPGEQQLASFDLEGAAETGLLGTDLGNVVTGFIGSGHQVGSPEIAAFMTEKLGLDKLQAPPGHEIVYRLAGSADGLANKNAGNLEGIISHAESSEDRGVLYGKVLTAYAVRMPKTFGEYGYLRQQGKQPPPKKSVPFDPSDRAAWDPTYRPRKGDADDEYNREENGRFAAGGGRAASADHLPDSPYRYFSKTPDSMLVPLAKLETTRHRESGIAEAEVRMASAYNGGRDKRKPITVRDLGNGKFSVVDGNSTTAVARKHGWTHVVAVVVAAKTDSDPDWFACARGDFDESLIERDENGKFSGGGSAINELAEAKKERVPREKSKPLPSSHTPEQHRAIAEKAIAEHDKVLPAELERMSGVVGKNAEISARTKSPDSALNKLREKPRYGTVDKLQDLTGMRVVAKDIDGVKSTVERIKANYEVVEEDNYIDHPKAGYRSHHMIVRTSAGLAEIQVRTANQHRFSEWSHNIYKPLDRAQERLARHPQFGKLVDDVSNHFWALDNGRVSAAPRIPGAVELVFGSPL